MQLPDLRNLVAACILENYIAVLKNALATGEEQGANNYFFVLLCSAAF